MENPARRLCLISKQWGLHSGSNASLLHARVKREAMARGLVVYPMGGTVDGARGDRVLLAPPYIVDALLLDTVVERLGEAIDAENW